MLITDNPPLCRAMVRRAGDGRHPDRAARRLGGGLLRLTAAYCGLLRLTAAYCGVSGQNQGIATTVVTPTTMFIGRPMRRKSEKRYPPAAWTSVLV